jgi:hypothetical protein
MFISVILSDARRSAATKSESKNPEDSSFIHAASAFRVFQPSATSEFLCALCVEILILTFALVLLRVSVPPWWMFLVAANNRIRAMPRRKFFL